MTTLKTIEAARKAAMLAAHTTQEEALARIDAAADPNCDDYTESERGERRLVIDRYEQATDVIQADFVAALAELPQREQARYRAQREADRADAD